LVHNVYFQATTEQCGIRTLEYRLTTVRINYTTLHL